MVKKVLLAIVAAAVLAVGTATVAPQPAQALLWSVDKSAKADWWRAHWAKKSAWLADKMAAKGR